MDVTDELKSWGDGLPRSVTGQQPYHLKVLGANSAAGLSVVSFEATERLGEPYSVKIRLTHPMDLDRMEYVRRDATFSIAPSDGSEPRQFSGCIFRFSKTRQTRDFCAYEMELRPKVALLTAAVCLALSLQGCNRHRPLTSQEQAIVKDLTAHLTPRCVGRYLIDMPADVHIFQSIKVEGVHISTEPMTIDAHRRAIQNRSDELTTAKSYFGYRFLYADQEVKGIPDSRYFVSLGSIYEDPDSIRIIEAYRWNSGHQIKMQVAASSAKDSLYFKDQPSIRDDPDMTNVSERLSQVISLLSRARGRSDDEIPGEPGVCFQGGFLQGKARDRENTSTMFVLNGHDDVSFNIDTDSDIQTEDSLLQRGAQIRTALSRSSGRTLRNGSVALKDLPAEEWLMAGKTVLRIQGFHFSLEANSVIGSPLSPLISLDLDVGAPNKLLNLHELDRVSLTEGESIALWDKVTRTLRPRPNAF